HTHTDAQRHTHLAGLSHWRLHIQLLMYRHTHTHTHRHNTTHTTTHTYTHRHTHPTTHPPTQQAPRTKTTSQSTKPSHNSHTNTHTRFFHTQRRQLLISHLSISPPLYPALVQGHWPLSLKRFTLS